MEEVESIVKQRRVLSPIKFNFYSEHLFNTTINNTDTGMLN